MDGIKQWMDGRCDYLQLKYMVEVRTF